MEKLCDLLLRNGRLNENPSTPIEPGADDGQMELGKSTAAAASERQPERPWGETNLGLIIRDTAS